MIKYTKETKTENGKQYGNFQSFLIENNLKKEGERSPEERKIKRILDETGEKLKDGKNVYYPVIAMITEAENLDLPTATTSNTNTESSFNIEDLNDAFDEIADLKNSLEFFKSKAEKLAEEAKTKDWNISNQQDTIRSQADEIKGYKRTIEANQKDDSAQTKAEREAKEKAKAEAKAATEAKAKAEAEAKAATEAKAKAEANAKATAEKLEKAEAAKAEAEANAKAAEAAKAKAEATAEKFKTRWEETQNKSNLRALIWLFIASSITAILTAIIAYKKFYVVTEDQTITAGFALIFAISMITANYYLPERTNWQKVLKVAVIAFFTAVEAASISLLLETFTKQYNTQIEYYFTILLTAILPVCNLIFSTILSNKLHK